LWDVATRRKERDRIILGRCLVVLFMTALLPILVPSSSHACSTFYIGNSARPVFGKNYDWSVDVGYLIVNKRGVSKEAMVGRKPATWISQYGSVSFNQYGRELPSGGMNEAGLVVELMWLDDTEYSARDERPGLGNMQWIQYQLDNSATVEEVIASDGAVRIESSGTSKIHYLVADRQGSCATIEFIDGKLQYHTRESLPWTVLTNHTYRSSLDYVKKFEGFGGNRVLSQSQSSLGRFANAAAMVDRFDDDGDQNSIDYGFDILQYVAQGEYTKWSIVYDIETETIHFRTFANKSRRYVRVADCDFDCDTPVTMFDINSAGSGDATGDFVRYTYDLNHGLIKDAFGQTSFLKAVPADVKRQLARYPAGLKCMYFAPSGE